MNYIRINLRGSKNNPKSYSMTLKYKTKMRK